MITVTFQDHIALLQLAAKQKLKVEFVRLLLRAIAAGETGLTRKDISESEMHALSDTRPWHKRWLITSMQNKRKHYQARPELSQELGITPEQAAALDRLFARLFKANRDSGHYAACVHIGANGGTATTSDLRKSIWTGGNSAVQTQRLRELETWGWLTMERRHQKTFLTITQPATDLFLNLK